MIPSHIGIIPDGNRRYGEKYRLSLPAAYGKGMEKVEDVLNWSKEAGIGVVTIWGFSTENFRRSLAERKIFFSLMKNKINELIDSKKLLKNGIRVKVIGKKELFEPKMASLFEKLEEQTGRCEKLQLNFAVGYGGRQEIVDACNRIIKSGKNSFTEESISSNLYTTGLPDPELIIRTSGESRLSGFMPWQSVYSELVFINSFWPELRKSEFMAAINEFNERSRRFGK